MTCIFVNLNFFFSDILKQDMHELSLASCVISKVSNNSAPQEKAPGQSE